MKNAVLITGASTGIGYDCAVTLAKRGFRVFAGVRSQNSHDKLQAQASNITPLILDVTVPSEIQRAYEIISAESPETFHLVNNAGIVVAGPVETLSIADVRRGFDVNFFGLVEVTQTFLPLIRKTKGRIVNISSTSGLIPAPFLGAYSASKYAVETFSDCLRWELAPAGVKVIVIEPGPIATPLWEKSFSSPSQIENGNFAAALPRFRELVGKMETTAIPAEKVSLAILHALTCKNPSARKIVGSFGAKVQVKMSRWLPQKWVDRAIARMLFG